MCRPSLWRCESITSPDPRPRHPASAQACIKTRHSFRKRAATATQHNTQAAAVYRRRRRRYSTHTAVFYVLLYCHNCFVCALTHGIRTHKHLPEHNTRSRAPRALHCAYNDHIISIHNDASHVLCRLLYTASTATTQQQHQAKHQHIIIIASRRHHKIYIALNAARRPPFLMRLLLWLP